MLEDDFKSQSPDMSTRSLNVVAGARYQRYLALFTALDIAAEPRTFLRIPSATRA